LDLGSSAKALAVDQTADRISAPHESGVLVSIEGEVAVPALPRFGGWPVGTAVDSATPTDDIRHVGGIYRGKLAARRCGRGSSVRAIRQPETAPRCDWFGHLVFACRYSRACQITAVRDITPSVGITGTPVIDTAQSEIFVVGDMLVNGTSAHTLVGPNTTIGKIEMTQDVDPPSSDPAALLQRTGLTLDAGQVVFGMGGNYGDCSTYRGRVVAVNEAGETPSFFTVDAGAGDSQGAIWMGDAAKRVTRS
jgi:hypothetical protein